MMASIYLAGIAYFIMGLHNNSARIIVRTIFMENIPNHIMGRVQTIFGVYTRAMVILSSLYAGWAIEYQNISWATNFTSFHFIIAFLGVIIIHIIWKNKIAYLWRFHIMPELPEVQTVVNQIRSDLLHEKVKIHNTNLAQSIS